MVKDMTGVLRRVLVRQPPMDVSEWRSLGWRSAPDPVALTAEHEALCGLLEEAGAEVVVAPAAGLDAIYAFDPILVTKRGALLLRPGKEARRAEPESLAPTLTVREFRSRAGSPSRASRRAAT